MGNRAGHAREGWLAQPLLFEKAIFTWAVKKARIVESTSSKTCRDDGKAFDFSL